MAELDIGQHCSVADCHQLDVLPVQCNLCSHTFCKLHAAYDAHSCPCYNQSVDENAALCTHSGNVISYACSVNGCRVRELVEVVCDACHHNYCFVHRHGADHQCLNAATRPAEPMQQTAEHVRKLIEAKPVAMKKSTVLSKKSAATAAKIALIKLKSKATGDPSVPDSDRVFFDVALPLSSGKKSAPMFFSKLWYIGKVVDKIAEAERLTNVNNQGGVQRLCLFEGSTGVLCPTGKTVKDILGEMSTDSANTPILYNGGTVIVEYVNSETQLLDTFEQYL